MRDDPSPLRLNRHRTARQEQADRRRSHRPERRHVVKRQRRHMGRSCCKCRCDDRDKLYRTSPARNEKSLPREEVQQALNSGWQLGRRISCNPIDDPGRRRGSSRTSKLCGRRCIASIETSYNIHRIKRADLLQCSYAFCTCESELALARRRGHLRCRRDVVQDANADALKAQNGNRQTR